jgi:RimJ/RimL family protein N-acetyltransferase
VLPTSLATPRFSLRPYRSGDGALEAEAVRSSYEHLARYVSWPRPDPDPVAMEITATTRAARFAAGEDFGMVVADPGGAFLGACGFHLRGLPLAHRQAEISLWLRASHAGAGLGTEILRAMLGWGFGDWGFERLAWVCRADNLPSRRAAEKAGMIQEGTIRGGLRLASGQRVDEIVYSLLRTDREAP